ncbi:MAG: HlyD family efflux transporter periplasmic adaptor subunit [Pseudomonadota bacterium]
MAPGEAAWQAAQRSIRRTVMIGILAAALLVVGLGGWAVTARLASAVVAPGVVVATGVNAVQHPAGGVVAAVYVRDGLTVVSGQPLLALEDIALEAERAVVDGQVVAYQARLARLVAERDGLAAIAVPGALAARRGEAAVDEALAKETRLFEVRRSRFQEASQQLSKRGKALNALIGALEKGRGGARTHDTSTRLAAALAQEAQNRLDRSALNTRREEAAEREGDALVAELAQLEARARVLDHALAGLTIRAPSAGAVFEMAAIGKGSVLRPGDTVMTIVAQDEPLDIEVRVPPADIDEVRVGQAVRVVMRALSGRAAPELAGEVVALGPEASVDRRTGQPYYQLRVALRPGEAAELLPDVLLRPGMPADVFIPTRSQTVAAYLLRPLTDQIRRTWRES